MLTYEDITTKLNNAIANANLVSIHVEEKIELRTCNREYINVCVKDDILNQKNKKIRAEISFAWDSTLTSESVYGGNCVLYHDESQPCIHDELEPEAFIELEIKYFFDILNNNINNEVISHVRRTLSDMFDNILSHNNKPRIIEEMLVGPDDCRKLYEVCAQHYWNIDLKMLDEDVSESNVFDKICQEIYFILNAIELFSLQQSLEQKGDKHIRLGAISEVAATKNDEYSEHNVGILTYGQREALLYGLTIVIDNLFDDYLSLENDESSKDQLYLLEFLPQQFKHHYNVLFIKKIIVCAVRISERIATWNEEEGVIPASTAECFVLKAIIDEAKSWLETKAENEELDPNTDFNVFEDLAFPDFDIELLFDPALDGIEYTQLAEKLGMNLKPSEWFEPVYAPVHPYVQENI